MTEETFTFTLARLEAHCKQAYNAGWARGYDKGNELGRKQGAHKSHIETMRGNGYVICGDLGDWTLCQYENGDPECIHCGGIPPLAPTEDTE